MNESNNPTNINGDWNITIDTPFGKQKYSTNIDGLNDNLTMLISHEKGIATLIGGSFVDGILNGSLEVEFPIKATVTFQANVIDDDKMFGTLQIDQYLETLFIGAR
jgi:hypothetical protein